MNYRELQAAIKQFRTRGLTEKTFKLNQKKTILMSEYERVTKLDIRPDKATDTDEVTLLKNRIGELESENKALKEEFDNYVGKVNDLVKESYQSGYNDCKKDLEFDETLRDRSEYHVENDEIDIKATIARLDYKHPKYEESVDIDDVLVSESSSSSSIAVINRPEIAEKIEYEIIECKYSQVIESEIIIDIKSEGDSRFIAK